MNRGEKQHVHSLVWKIMVFIALKLLQPISCHVQCKWTHMGALPIYLSVDVHVFSYPHKMSTLNSEIKSKSEIVSRVMFLFPTKTLV